MKIAIFAENISNGIKYLEEIIGEMKYKEVREFSVNPNQTVKAKAFLKNGDEYFVLPTDDSVRGFRWDKAIVSRNLSSNVLLRILSGFTEGVVVWEENLVGFDE